MDALSHWKERRPREAVLELQKEIRADPGNARQRVFLFQLLAVLGEWDRALTQLAVLGDLDAGMLAMVHTYREAIRCELLRGGVFAGRRAPLIFGEPTRWLALLVEAVRLSAAGHHAEAGALRAQALAEAPASPGRIDGHGFEWIADADSRLGPVLEAVVHGRYYWIPFSRVARIDLEAPADLRDLVWMPARLTWLNGGVAVGLIPSRYPGSEACPDVAVQTARKTQWLEPAPGTYWGLGQRLWVTDGGEYALFDVREILLHGEAAAHG
ncbi:type VI secretion system accessory protein TagJ [Candidatus Methylocalor cossyra]|uniref:Type VI secretion system accessory component TagJ n=1 Tax=Candidatus Methylocalor cossyra TaxID=3108543 RepID=A0ABM9NGK7_9GAMM